MNVNPYLFFDGKCEEALNFYKTAIDAKVGMMMRFNESPEQSPGCTPSDGNKVMHACFNVGDSPVMASDGQYRLCRRATIASASTTTSSVVTGTTGIVTGRIVAA